MPSWVLLTKHTIIVVVFSRAHVGASSSISGAIVHMDLCLASESLDFLACYFLPLEVSVRVSLVDCLGLILCLPSFPTCGCIKGLR